MPSYLFYVPESGAKATLQAIVASTTPFLATFNAKFCCVLFEQTKQVGNNTVRLRLLQLQPNFTPNIISSSSSSGDLQY